MDLVGAFLGVIAIIGIVIVGGFVIFFLGDLVLSILDPNYVRFGKKKKENKKDEELTNEFDKFLNQTKEKIDGPKQETKEIEFEKNVNDEKLDIKTAPVIEEGLGDDFFDDLEDAKKEEAFEEKKSNDLDALRAEEEQFKQNMLKAIQERRAQNQVNSESEEEIDLDKFFFEEDEDFEKNLFEETEIEGQENLEDLLIQNAVNINEEKDNAIEFKEIPVEQLIENSEVDNEESENDEEKQEEVNEIEKEEINNDEEINSEELDKDELTDVAENKSQNNNIENEDTDKDEEDFGMEGSYLEVDTLIDQYEAEIAN